jgi:ABC-type sugar transport system ATPase subunit
MRGIVKTFPGVRALDGVTLDVRRGEVLALVGENGAGKSTLMKILAGAQRADSGEILIDGTPARINDPRAAERYGIGMIYQEFNLVPTLGAVENILLGMEPMRGLFLDRSAARATATATLAKLGITLPFHLPASRMTVAQQQLVEIAKVLARRARLIVMDEPTAALSARETEQLFRLIAALRVEGVSFIYISHRLEELESVADRITILRDGRTIETRPAQAFTRDAIVTAMTGRAIDTEFPPLPPIPENAPVALEVIALQSALLPNAISFRVRAGEILGIAGLVGAGRTEILRAIAGADPSQGIVLIDGMPIEHSVPRQTIDHGVAFITEDRKAQGLVLDMSVRQNTTLAHLASFSKGPFTDSVAEERITSKSIANLRIRTPSSAQRVRNLSGGNQQKVVLAKWLIRPARALLFDEPTRGIDVGAKAEIHTLLAALAAAGSAIVMVSSELPEVLGMAHRLLVLRDHAIVAEFTREEASAETVIAAAMGATA